VLARQAGQVALVQAASDASAIITGGQLMIALNSGIGMPINIQTLSLAESAKVFGMMLSISTGSADRADHAIDGDRMSTVSYVRDRIGWLRIERDRLRALQPDSIDIQQVELQLRLAERDLDRLLGQDENVVAGSTEAPPRPADLMGPNVGPAAQDAQAIDDTVPRTIRWRHDRD